MSKLHQYHSNPPLPSSFLYMFYARRRQKLRLYRLLRKQYVGRNCRHLENFAKSRGLTLLDVVSKACRIKAEVQEKTRGAYNLCYPFF